MASRKLIVNSQLQRAQLLKDGVIEIVYIVSTASNGRGCEIDSYCTPNGLLKVAKKIGDGEPIGSVFSARVPVGEIWSTNSSNPLSSSEEDLVLSRILWLEGAEKQNMNTLDRFIYLHGTNHESSLGQPCSHGCIRFSNSDILEIFEFLSVGDNIEVI